MGDQPKGDIEMASDARPVSVTDLHNHYVRRFHEQSGRLPRAEDLDLTLVRTFLQMCGPDRAIPILDLWFDADDPWYAHAGFEFSNVFAAVNRMVATGRLEPGGKTPQQNEAIRQFAIASLHPRLRLVR